VNSTVVSMAAGELSYCSSYVFDACPHIDALQMLLIVISNSGGSRNFGKGELKV